MSLEATTNGFYHPYFNFDVTAQSPKMNGHAHEESPLASAQASVESSPHASHAHSLEFCFQDDQSRYDFLMTLQKLKSLALPSQAKPQAQAIKHSEMEVKHDSSSKGAIDAEKAKVDAFALEVTNRIAGDKSRCEAFELTLAKLLDDDVAMMEACRTKSSASALPLPTERLVVIEYFACAVEKKLKERSFVHLVHESSKNDPEDIEKCIHYAAKTALFDLMKQSADLRCLTKRVREMAPNWLERMKKLRASDLD